MTSASQSHSKKPPTYLQPNHFADYLSPQQQYCLFLDIDGTLADFTLKPQDSVVPQTTLLLLQRIQNCGVKIAVVTGRSLAEARQMLSPIHLPIAATHGLEIALADIKDRGNNNSFHNNSNDKKDSNSAKNNVIQVDSAELMAIKQAITQSCLSYADFTIEDKPYSVALHYRQDPSLADIAYSIMSDTLKNHSNWILKQGKFVWEAMPKGVDKGSAILTLLNKMQTNSELCPIFIGDDITDEAGFRAVQAHSQSLEMEQVMDNPQKLVHGIGIKVGTSPTCADYYVYNIQEVTALLNHFLSFCQTHIIRRPSLTHKK
ncbi:trehalose-phosphatase [Psychrobacter pygoscelis]|uniref:trehalose-phosphatase n=1 Tax=Psychrobacter pygoscelis TaxID=2488563 RepID=UPI0010404C77|nr:trehalose-phosphatase [Psychrobacter pygoscelis]